MAYLVLSNGMAFEGTRIGAPGNTVGELVFTTGVVGYLETLTDPSYAGQIVMQTFPLIGNYGVIEADFEGEPALKGYVVRELCTTPSNFRSQYALDRFLKDRGIPGIAGVDTRRLTRILRCEGVMNAAICDTILADLTVIRSYRIESPVAAVSCKTPQVFPAEGETKYRITLIDYGEKRNIVRSLQQRGCEVTVVPHDTTAEAILQSGADGVMLSNGPGDPKDNVFEIEQVRRLIGRIPVFGICLGHQLAALALGGNTVKLPYGHRGANQPVRDCSGHRTYITTQNHGYAVAADSLGEQAVVTYVNANDNSVEGVRYPSKRCFTVQFHPEACAGPNDTGFLFDRFLAMIGGDN